MTPRERDELIDRLLDRDITEADFLRLEAELHVDPAAREAYYERLTLHTLLGAETKESSPSQAFASSDSPPSSGTWKWLALAAAALFGLGFLVLALRAVPTGTTAPKTVEKAEPVAIGFATLADQVDAIWAGGPVPRRGELVPQGELRLTSGTVQLEFFSGVWVAIEGEATFEVVSPMELHVAKGALRARVPEPAQGFRVRTPSGELVDLGTEFALDVNGTQADLAVLDGEVEWHPTGADIQNLGKGQSLRWRDGTAESLAFDRDRLVVLADPEQARATRREAWVQHSQTLAQDPRLLAYFSFSQQGPWNRVLANASPRSTAGTIVRAERAPDRFGHPRAALDFSPTGSRVRFHVPGTHAHLTLACWVKIDSLDRWYNSLLLTDGHEENEPHWQIMDDGRLFFSVKKQDMTPEKRKRGEMDKHIFYSPSFWTPQRSGQWLHIATVYDTDSKRCTHYLNGTMLSEETIPDFYLVDTIQIGAASIGNWSQPRRDDPHFAVRNLNGSMDEFAIFADALSAGEIKDMFEAGRP